MKRELSQKFMAGLTSGLLNPVLKRVRRDRSLCLEIREDYLNIYYRGGNLLKLSRAESGYQAAFDREYFKHARLMPTQLPASIGMEEDIEAWIEAMPQLKQAMDLFPKHPIEREMQQQLLAQNNFWKDARGTDYYLCDIEYAGEHGRFDFVAVHWPSTPAERRRATGRRLVIGEVKYGDGSLDGEAGLLEHVRDIAHFTGDAGKVRALKSEMVSVFNQKRELGLIDCGMDLAGFSSEPPLVMLVLVNHDPGKTRLVQCFRDLLAQPHDHIRIARASGMGLGLYDEGMKTVEMALRAFKG